MEGRIVSTLFTDGENTVTKIKGNFTLVFGHIIVLDEPGYKLFQFKQQFHSLSSPLDHR